MFFSQEQPHYLSMPISYSPYEWLRTRTIALVHVPSVHLYQGSCKFNDAEVRDTVQRRKRPTTRNILNGKPLLTDF